MQSGALGQGVFGGKIVNFAGWNSQNSWSRQYEWEAKIDYLGCFFGFFGGENCCFWSVESVSLWYIAVCNNAKSDACTTTRWASLISTRFSVILNHNLLLFFFTTTVDYFLTTTAWFLKTTETTGTTERTGATADVTRWHTTQTTLLPQMELLFLLSLLSSKS